MRFPLMIGLLLLAAACGVKKQMDDVHSNAGSMAKTTDRIEATTDVIQGAFENGMLVAGQGGGSISRDELLRQLIETRDIEEKFLYAAKYFYAFEFQFWTLGTDRTASLALREQLKAEAVTEFGRVLYRFNRQLRRGTAVARDNMSNSLYALVGTVERHNPLQPSLLANTGVPSAMMLEILQNGLLKAQALNRGHINRDHLSAAEREVLREEQMFTRFLQLRSKVLPVLALGLTSDIQSGIWPQLNMRFRAWTPRFGASDTTVTNTSGLNVEQLGFAADKLDERAREQRVLQTLEATVPLDRDVRAIWSNMDLAPLRHRLEADPQKNLAISSALDRFDILVQDLLRP